MTKTIKVLLADDSAVVRRLLKQVLDKNERIEVVGQAKNGEEAVGHFSGCQPDVVVLDVEMPVMNGIQAAAAINALDSNVPIIMFSTITTKGAETTLDALSCGACDYETKPSMVGHLSEAISHLVDHLVPKIISWGEKRHASLEQNTGIRRLAVKRPDPTNIDASPFDVIAVGVSTGGPNALREFLSEFPLDFGIPIVIVQHMPPVFTRIMAERLDKSCQLRVREAEDGSVLNPSTVWIAPGDFHMEVIRSGAKMITRLNQDEQVNFCRPAVDVLFQSIAQVYGNASLGVILTGMGSDGLKGCQDIHKKGGSVMAQDHASSSVWGMPGAVSDANLVSCLLPPRELAKHIVELHAC